MLNLSLNLRGVISQRLLPAEGGGRVAAYEVLIDPHARAGYDASLQPVAKEPDQDDEDEARAWLAAQKGIAEALPVRDLEPRDKVEKFLNRFVGGLVKTLDVI